MRDTMTGIDPAPISYLSETQPGTNTLQLRAAVVSRGVPTPSALIGGGGPLGWLRAARHRLWLRLGPLGADVSVNGRPLFGGVEFAARSVRIAGLPPRGEPLAYYDDSSHALRVLGRVIAVPPYGEALVALVDASGRRAGAPRLVLRVVRAPPVTVPTILPPPLPGAAVSQAYFLSEHPAWTAALRADPIVRAFLDRDDRES